LEARKKKKKEKRKKKRETKGNSCETGPEKDTQKKGSGAAERQEKEQKIKRAQKN